MPDLSGKGITQTILTPHNTVLNYYLRPGSKEGSKNWEYAAAITTHPNCKPTMKPFAVQSFEKKEIYIDSNFDREIDHVYKNAHKDAILRFRHSCKYQGKKV